MLPLEGIKILDFSHAAAGPYCSMLLADMGADVIKVEPKHGEHFRPVMGSSIFYNINRNKKGIVVDLNALEGKKIVKTLARQSDVILESFTPGSMDKLGIGYEVIKDINPGIIYASISGFGQTGPYWKRPGYDAVAQAMSGLMMANGEAERLPSRIASSVIDLSAGLFTAFGITLALRQRDKTGEGCRIDMSLLETAISWMNMWVTNYSMYGKLPKRMGSAHDMFAPYKVFPTKDKLVFIGISTNKFFEAFCRSFGLEYLLGKEEYSTNELRCLHREELDKAVAEAVGNYSSEELLAKLQEIGIPHAPVLNIDEMIEHPQVVARDIIAEADQPGFGKIKTTKFSIHMSGIDRSIRMPSPQLGAHTEDVLLNLGYSKKDIDDLEHKGVVWRGT
ncbi:MAG: CaiB/BaiF CoA-transferase family protein [Desulfitobacteriaceae bacterium]